MWQQQQLLRDQRFTFLKPSALAAKSIAIRSLAAFNNKYNSIVSNTQYSYKGGRYVVQTKDVTNYQNLNELFGLDEFFRSIFYAKLILWYSGGTRLYLDKNRSQYIDLGQEIVMGKSSTQLSRTILTHQQMRPVVTDRSTLALDFTFTEVFNTLTTEYVLCQVASGADNEDVFDPLVVSCRGDNSLVIRLDGTAYYIRLFNPTIRNSLIISFFDLNNILPKVNIFLNGVQVVSEYLSLENGLKHGMGGSITFSNNPLSSYTINELVCTELTEPDEDYAFFKTLAATATLKEFFANDDMYKFALYPDELRIKYSNNYYFTCNGEGFQTDETRTYPIVSGGSAWTGSWNFAENFFAIQIAGKLLDVSNTNSVVSFISLGSLSVQLVLTTPLVHLGVVYNEQNITVAQNTLQQEKFDIKIVISQKSKVAPRDIERSIIKVLLDDKLVAKRETPLLTGLAAPLVIENASPVRVQLENISILMKRKPDL